jgi:hypothetical protein
MKRRIKVFPKFKSNIRNTFVVLHDAVAVFEQPGSMAGNVRAVQRK